MKIYIANGCVIHEVQMGWDEELTVNGAPIEMRFPQAIPKGCVLKAYKKDRVLKEYKRQDGSVVSLEEYDKKKYECVVSEEDGEAEYATLQREFEWRKFTLGIETVWVETREERPYEVVNFTATETGIPYVKSIPMYGEQASLKCLESGEYFKYFPIKREMLEQAVRQAGMDMVKFKHEKGRDDDVRFAMYGEHCLFNEEPDIGGLSYVTLARAEEEYRKDTRWFADHLIAFNRRHDDRPLSVGDGVQFLEYIKGTLARMKPNNTTDKTLRIHVMGEIDAKILSWGGRPTDVLK